MKVQASALILKKDGRILIHRRPVGEVMGGLWEFPEWKISTSTFLKEKGLRAKTSRLILEDFGLETPRLKLLKTIKRSYTHHQETLHVFESDLAGGKFKPLKKWPLEWVTQKEFKNYPFSSAHSKIAHFISV